MTMRPIIPAVILLPVLAAALAVIIFIAVRKKQKTVHKILRVLRAAGIFALIFLIDLRIQHKRYDMDVELKNIDILFVVDTTISMWAEDGIEYETRMEQASADCEHIMEEMAGSNFGLIRFDNRSQILAPFTQDRKNVADALKTIRTLDSSYARGSSMNVPMQDMEDLLISSSQKKDRTTVLFFLSDGEITDGSELESYEYLEPYVDAGAVLGYGSLEGGRMEDTAGWGYIQDPETGQDAVSYIDEQNLQLIAQDLGIEYIRMRSPMDVDYLLASVRAGSTVSIGDTNAVVYDDTYYYYIIPLAALLLWELVLFVRKRRL